MKSWLIFKHSIRQVTGNWRAVSRIVLPIIIISFALEALLFRDFLFLSANDIQKLDASIASSNFAGHSWEIVAGFLLNFLLGLAVAVAWHRYILLNEVPSWPPKFHFMRMWIYLLKGWLIAIPIFLLFFVLMGGLSMLLVSLGEIAGAYHGIIGSFALLLMLPVLLVISLRLSTILPGAAIGAPTSLRETWSKTSGQTGMFLALGMFIGLLAILLNLTGFLFTFLPLIATLALQTLVIFIQTLVLLSILTTLYGHYIEKRPLVS